MIMTIRISMTNYTRWSEFREKALGQLEPFRASDFPRCWNLIGDQFVFRSNHSEKKFVYWKYLTLMNVNSFDHSLENFIPMKMVLKLIRHFKRMKMLKRWEKILIFFLFMKVLTFLSNFNLNLIIVKLTFLCITINVRCSRLFQNWFS